MSSSVMFSAKNTKRCRLQMQTLTQSLCSVVIFIQKTPGIRGVEAGRSQNQESSPIQAKKSKGHRQKSKI